MVNISRILFKQPSTPKELYKVLLRKCDLLPKDAGKFYKQSVRKEFDQHQDELDAERIQQIIERSLKDADWILNKYNKK